MLYVVGIGPGGPAYMTKEAEDILWESDLIIGYTTYIELIRPYYPQKEYYDTSMRQEKERCERALEEARKGRCVALVCSGDSAVYGMAALVYELAGKLGVPSEQIGIIAGVTAALSGGAVLGAPLTNDFMVVSLSDLLTPWEKIEKRIQAAAVSDTVLCLYNPGSHKRRDHLRRACELVLEYQPETTVCGYVRNIGREEQVYGVMSLAELKDFEPDMFMTVFIGNSATINQNGKMITRRGYRNV